MKQLFQEMIFLTLGELLNPSLLTKFSESLETSFPRSDLRADFTSKVLKNNFNFTALYKRYVNQFQDYHKMTKDIRDFYFSKSDGHITNDTVREYNDLMSDTWFVYGIDQAVKAFAKRTTGNVFYYLFSMETKLNFVKSGFGQVPSTFNFPGTSHADDLFYIFYFQLVYIVRAVTF